MNQPENQSPVTPADIAKAVKVSAPYFNTFVLLPWFGGFKLSLGEKIAIDLNADGNRSLHTTFHTGAYTTLDIVLALRDALNSQFPPGRNGRDPGEPAPQKPFTPADFMGED